MYVSERGHGTTTGVENLEILGGSSLENAEQIEGTQSDEVRNGAED